MDKLSPEILADAFKVLETTRASPGESVPAFIVRALSDFEPAALRPFTIKAALHVAGVVEVLKDDASLEHVEGVWRLLHHPTNISVLERAIDHIHGD